MLSPKQNHNQRLAQSLARTSIDSSRALGKFWKKMYGCDSSPLRFGLSHPQSALEILSHEDGILLAPDILDQRSIHIAAAFCPPQSFLRCLETLGVNIDIRDKLQSTALFMAAANGHDGNTGHLWPYNFPRTILEVAALGGHFKVVRRLVGEREIQMKTQFSNAHICSPCGPSRKTTRVLVGWGHLSLGLTSRRGG